MNRLLPVLFAFVYLSTSSYAKVIFECDFEKDTCGLFNDDHHGAKWVRKFMDLGGRKGYVMFLETDGKVKQMGRLLTPFIELERSGVVGCTMLEYLVNGDGVTAFSKKQLDDSGVKRHTIKRSGPVWRRVVDGIATGGKSVRFMFEAEVDPNLGETVVAINKISFLTTGCEV